MKGNIRNIYPGGNTSQGFYSYYNFILPQNKAEKIICLKGGPGVGKSTLMKRVGACFEEENESIDYMWCSSDPDSLDGVLLKDRNVAIIDGTAPHIIDPVNPAAVDEILDLGKYWNISEIRKNKSRILELSGRTGKMFKAAYGYLAIAGYQYKFLWEVMADLMGKSEVSGLRRQLNEKLHFLTPIKRAENKVKHQVILGNTAVRGEESRFFAGAITPAGIKSSLLSLLKPLQKIILLETPVGFKSQLLLEPAAERFLDAGYMVEKYYCPLDPENKIEHIIIPEVKTAVITVNSYHNIHPAYGGKKVEEIQVQLSDESICHNEIIRQLREDIDGNIQLAVKYLAMAKGLHDELEEYYYPNMKYDKIDQVTEEIIENIRAL